MISEEAFNLLLKQAGLEVPQGERESLKAFFMTSIYRSLKLSTELM